jgi:hypothetical protein
MGQSTDAMMGWGIAYASEGGCDYDAIEAATNRLKSEGIDAAIHTHCSGDCPMLAIVIPSTYRRAWRGSPKRCDDLFALIQRETWGANIHRALEVYLEELAKTEAVEFIKEYRKDYAIEPGQLGWYLFSDWS